MVDSICQRLHCGYLAESLILKKHAETSKCLDAIICLTMRTTGWENGINVDVRIRRLEWLILVFVLILHHTNWSSERNGSHRMCPLHIIFAELLTAHVAICTYNWPFMSVYQVCGAMLMELWIAHCATSPALMVTNATVFSANETLISMLLSIRI